MFLLESQVQGETVQNLLNMAMFLHRFSCNIKNPTKSAHLEFNYI
jgi:hypothetical protein